MSPVLLVCMIFIVAAHPVIGAPDVNLKEVDALYALRQGLTDPNEILTNWDWILVNPCTFWRVMCNNDNSVTKINLGWTSLSGQMVGDLGKLTKLEHLLLNNNNISGSIPDELGGLTSLLDMDLSNNFLTDSIPDSLGDLKALKYLRLNNNNLTGSIPKSLTGLDQLLVLNLSSNQLRGPIPSELFNLTNLRYLDLTNNAGLKGGRYQCTDKPCYFNNFG